MIVIKPNKLLWPITIDANITMNQSEPEANTCNRRQARENKCEQDTNGFDFNSHWLKFCESAASFVNQTQSVIKQNQSKRAITFDMQLKTVLYTVVFH